MTTEIVTSIVSSLLGGLVGGLFTFLGVKMTIRYEREKDAKEEERRRKEKEELIKQKRPRLEIVNYAEIKKYDFNENFHSSVLLAHIEKHDNGHFTYDPRVFTSDEWVCVEYEFKNIGLTEIHHLYISTNLVKSTSIFDVLSGENVSYAKRNMLNYSVYSDKTIKPNETYRLQICYIKDKILCSNIGSAPITIWISDIDGNWWAQSLFAPRDYIDNSYKTSHKEWRSNTDEITAMKCFNNPMEW